MRFKISLVTASLAFLLTQAAFSEIVSPAPRGIVCASMKSIQTSPESSQPLHVMTVFFNDVGQTRTWDDSVPSANYSYSPKPGQISNDNYTTEFRDPGYVRDSDIGLLNGQDPVGGPRRDSVLLEKIPFLSRNSIAKMNMHIFAEIFPPEGIAVEVQCQLFGDLSPWLLRYLGVPVTNL